MAVATVAGTVGAGALATTLVALWAYANGDDVGESAKKVWDYTKENLKNIGKGTLNIFDKLNPDGESMKSKLHETVNETVNKIKNNGEEPPKNKNPSPNIPVNPQGAIAGAITGINNSDNNFIKDTTNENIEQNIGSSFNDYIAKMEEYQQKQWEREDTAYQRAVEDARKAGINVGTLAGNIQPAQSSTNIMASGNNTQFQEIAELIQQEIDNNFKGNENEKDRLTQGIQMLLMMALMKK